MNGITMPCSRPTFRYFPSVIRSKRAAEGRRYV
jgi:hypothetical protein